MFYLKGVHHEKSRSLSRMYHPHPCTFDLFFRRFCISLFWRSDPDNDPGPDSQERRDRTCRRDLPAPCGSSCLTDKRSLICVLSAPHVFPAPEQYCLYILNRRGSGPLLLILFHRKITPNRPVLFNYRFQNLNRICNHAGTEDPEQVVGAGVFHSFIS